MHILELSKNSAAYWMPFLFMHFLLQAHKKHVNLQWFKWVSWRDPTISYSPSCHVSCCPHLLLLADSSVIHHILFQIQLLTTDSPHILVCQKFLIFQALVNWLSVIGELRITLRCQDENVIFSRTSDVLWKLKGHWLRESQKHCV